MSVFSGYISDADTKFMDHLAFSHDRSFVHVCSNERTCV